MSEEDLQTLIQQKSPAIFFSQDLCARYFTYSQDGETHFVLFDDAGSIRKKLQIAAALGISRAVLALEQAEELLPGLLRPSPGGK